MGDKKSEASFAEAVRAVRQRPHERLARVRALSLPERCALFETLSPHLQQSLLSLLSTGEIVDILDHLDFRRARQLLARLKGERRRAHIVRRLKSDLKEKLEYFLRFHPKATLGLVNLNYLFLPAESTIAEAADAIDEHYDETGKLPELLVHERGRLLGEVPLSSLVRERNSAQLKKYLRPVVTIGYLAEVAEVVDAIVRLKRKKLVVLDHDESVLGIIYADEALALFGHLPTESLYEVAGVDDSERPFDAPALKFKNRHRWLILNLLTCFLAGSVIYLFEATLEALVILSVYIPIVLGMGSNAGSQTFAVMLRGLVLGTISLKNGWPAIAREVSAGFLNGCLIGGIVALVSVVWNADPLLGVVVGLSMIGVHVVAAFFGAFLPLFFKHIGKDPAVITTIFVTTATDVLGLFFLLGLGSLLLL
jgi:magnesium transporter